MKRVGTCPECGRLFRVEYALGSHGTLGASCDYRGKPRAPFYDYDEERDELVPVRPAKRERRKK